MARFFSRFGRYLLAVLGLFAIGILVRELGVDAVLETLVQAGVWLPLILLLDIGWMAVESGAALNLYGPKAKAVRLQDWLRAVFVHYATFVVVPVGRASAEVARAGVLSPRVGKTRAAAGAAVMQSLTLTANSMVSAVCFIALMTTSKHQAASALMSVNMLATGTLGVGLYLVLRHVKVGGFLGRRFSKMSQWGPEIDEHVREGRRRHSTALMICVGARLVQALQYGVILYAVSGSFSASGALISEGIQLGARTMGDAIPNQVGVTEGAFALCAGAVGLEDFPEKAVAIALLGRISNLSMVGFCALSLQFLPKNSTALSVARVEKA